MSLFENLLETFGIARMPWVIRVFLILLLVFTGLAIYAASQIPPNAPKDYYHPVATLFAFSIDTLKIVLGALLGALSLATEKAFSPKT